MSKLKYAVMEYSMPEWATGDCREVEEFDDVEQALTLCDKLDRENKDDSIFYSTIVYRNI